MVVADGTAEERGHAAGRELGDLIHRSLAFYRNYLERRGLSGRTLEEELVPFLTAAERHTPDAVAYLRGLASAADAPFPELFAVNTFEELEPLLDRPRSPTRCTTFAVQTPQSTILAHNEHWLAGDLGNVVVIAELVPGGWIASPTAACNLPASGMNSSGLALGIQSLTASDDGPGVPRVLVSRAVLAADGIASAHERASLPSRAGGYGYLLGRRGGTICCIETSGKRSATVKTRVHTNHYLDPDLAALAPPPTDGSLGRYRAVSDALAASRVETPEDAMRILRDVDFLPTAAADDPPDEEEAIVFSMVCEVESGRMWVAFGDPKSTPYEPVPLPEAT